MKRRTSRSRLQVRKLLQMYEQLRPRTPAALHAAIHRLLNVDVPSSARIAGNDAPFDYVAHVFFEGRVPGQTLQHTARGADCIVWANRGGGKTWLGALATMLDMIFKPGIQIRILGGSLEQSTRMYHYLRQMFQRPGLRILVDGTPTQQRIALVNGSTVELLAQSHRSVRGHRVHKLRCDEVDEFTEDIWQAAQAVTRSGLCGQVHVTGSVEALSTMHRPFGMMARLIDHARRFHQPRIFRWNALDVIARCPPQRPCEPCAIHDDCRGMAKASHGFIAVDDLVAQRLRTSDETWASELLCRRPQRSDCVYPSFSLSRHLRPVTPTGRIIAGMDFGIRSPTVVLWAHLRNRGEEQILEVFDEYVAQGSTLECHLEAIAARGWNIDWIGVDPAGDQRNSQTGISDIALLRRHGYTIRTLRHPLAEGIARIRRRLDRDTLFIDPRCSHLIEAMSTYHFARDNPADPNPVKDGPDHICDALRYLVINLDRDWHVRVRRY